MNDLLYEYIRDPSNPEKCFNLAVAYYKEGQTAAATSFFIRAADRSGDDLILHMNVYFMLVLVLIKETD